MVNPIRLALGGQPQPQPPQGTPSAGPQPTVGGPIYGFGDFAPTRGKLGNTAGYQQRDVTAAHRRDAILKRLGQAPLG